MFTLGLAMFLGSFLFGYHRWGRGAEARAAIMAEKDAYVAVFFLVLFFGGSVLMVLKIIVLMWTYLF